jgi:hypothetical protein
VSWHRLDKTKYWKKLYFSVLLENFLKISRTRKRTRELFLCFDLFSLSFLLSYSGSSNTQILRQYGHEVSQPVHLSVRPSIRLSVCPSDYPSICLYFFLIPELGLTSLRQIASFLFIFHDSKVLTIQYYTIKYIIQLTFFAI